jgi:ATP-dependent Lhr-like helicase
LAALPDVIDPKQQVSNYRLRLLPTSEQKPAPWRAIDGAAVHIASAVPAVSARAVSGLKFNEVLPPGLAAETLALRGIDREGATTASTEPRFVVLGS